MIFTSNFVKKLSVATAGAAFMALGAVNTAQAATIVTPGNLETTEGNLRNGFPFNIDLLGLSSQRYQQVYDASEFASLSGPQLITQILFRPDSSFGSAFSSTLPDIQINFSTTSAAVDGLSTTFADNVGSDDTVVFDGPLSLSSADTGAPGGPRDFDIAIVLDIPFLYDPNLGNLLLDVRNFGGGLTTQFDAENTFGDSISRVFSFSGGVNSPTGITGSSGTWGLVTQFVTEEPVSTPEPVSTLTLLAFGAVGAGSMLKRKQQ